MNGLLGRGAMGVVHRAVHVRLGREVALKVLAPLLDSDREARFAREIEVLRALSHPNVVQLLDGGEHEGQLWYAMELVEGPTLTQRLKQGPAFETDEILSILNQILEALAYLHQRGVIHRDVTSSNVLLAPGGRVVLSDFGLARGSTRLTAPGIAVGTPIYMAPEALKGDSTPASDLFGAGVVAYELFTGHNPFLSKTVEQTVMKILGEPLPPPPGVDGRVVEVVMRLVERDPARRWRSARDAQAALADVTAPKSQGPKPRRPSRTTPVAGAKTQVLPPPRRGKAAAVAAGLVLVAALGALAMRRPAPVPTPGPTPSVAAAPVPALRLPGARVVPLVHGARVLARNPAKAPLLIELGRGQPPTWREAARTSDATVSYEISGLVPDTAYAVRVRADGFTGGLPGHAFRTLTKAQERAADDVAAMLNDPEVAANPLFGDALAFSPPDARFRQPLLDLLSGAAQLADDQVLAIAGYAVNAPDRRLASRLVERLPTVKWSQARARVVHAAVAAELPGATALASENLRHWSADDLLERLPSLGHVMSPAELADVLAKQAGAPGHVRMLSLAPEPERLAEAARLFEENSPRDPTLFAELGHLLPPGAAGDAVLERARPERRRAALLAAPRPIACRLLAEPAPDAGVEAWAEWLRAGCADARPRLEQRIEQARGPAAARAVTALSTPASAPFLVKALAREDLADAAAWALAEARHADALPALRGARDPRGVILWARARLGDRDAAPDVLRALADPKPAQADARVKLALAAWAAGELNLASATAHLTAIVAETRAPPFARACARSALSWIAGAPRPRTFLLLPEQDTLDTDLSVGQLDSFGAWAEAAEGAAGATAAHVGVPLWLAPVASQPARLMAQVPGRLRIARAGRPVAESKSGSLLRVSIEPPPR